MIRDIEVLSHDMEIQMQLAQEKLQNSSNLKNAKRKIKIQKMKEIERDIKKEKMNRIKNMLGKLDRQAKAVGQLEANELQIRMHLKRKLM